MLMPTRTILALAAGSLALGLVGAGTAVADGGGQALAAPAQAAAAVEGTVQPADGWERYPIGKIVSKGKLKVRSQPNTRSEVVNHVYPNRRVAIECKTYSESVDGNSIWYRLHKHYGAGPEDKAYGSGHWVSARYVDNLSPVKHCH